MHRCFVPLQLALCLRTLAPWGLSHTSEVQMRLHHCTGTTSGPSPRAWTATPRPPSGSRGAPSPRRCATKLRPTSCAARRRTCCQRTAPAPRGGPPAGAAAAGLQVGPSIVNKQDLTPCSLLRVVASWGALRNSWWVEQVNERFGCVVTAEHGASSSGAAQSGAQPQAKPGDKQGQKHSLPRKNDLVVWLRLTPIQKAVYRAALETGAGLGHAQSSPSEHACH